MESGELLPFDSLTEIYGLSTGQFLRYESLKNSIRTLGRDWGGDTGSLSITMYLDNGQK